MDRNPVRRNILIMRKKALFILVAAIICSCQKPLPVPTTGDEEPSISIPDTIVTAGWKRGKYVIEYEVNNPVPKGKIEITDIPEWIELDGNSDTSASLTVKTNVFPETRNAELTIIYRFGEGLAKTKTLTVIQEATGFEADVIFFRTRKPQTYFQSELRKERTYWEFREKPNRERSRLLDLTGLPYRKDTTYRRKA